MMSVKVIGKHEKDSMMRDAFGDTLLKLMEENKNVVYIDADLMACINTKRVCKAFPERCFNTGIMEANMMGVAAGLSATGKIPYVHSFGPFATRRSFDQVFLACAYAKLNVKINGSDPGVTAAFNGGTHMPFEDMGLMLNIPTMVVLEPCDCVQYAAVMKEEAARYGVSYTRMVRKNPIKVYEEGSEFKIGKGVTLKDGADVTIIASGIMVDEALKAYDLLAAEGISARIVDMFTWKPIDAELIEKCAKETGAIVTAENHNILTGLGSMVAKVVTEGTPVPMERVGINDEFGEVGPEAYLRERFNLTVANIAEHAKRAIARKAK